MNDEQQPLLTQEDEVERYVVDMKAEMEEMGLTGRISNVRFSELYTRGREYCTRWNGTKLGLIHGGVKSAALEYLNSVSMDRRTLPAALKGAIFALKMMCRIVTYIDDQYQEVMKESGQVGVSMADRVKKYVADKKSECCAVFRCSMEELEQKILSASFLSAQDLEAGSLEVEYMDSSFFEVGQLGSQQYRSGVGVGIGGAVYCLAIIGTTLLDKHNSDSFAVTVLAVSRALWFVVIAESQLTHFKHSISAVLADMSLQYTILLHSVLFLTGFSFGMAFVLGDVSLPSKVLGFLIVVSFFGILVCPISRNNSNVAFKQKLHWTMVSVLGASFFFLTIWNWEEWLEVQKGSCIVSGVAFLVFALFNARNIRTFPSWMQALVEHRIWIEFVALELVFILTFWTLSGIAI